MPTPLDHVAFVVPSIEDAAATLPVPADLGAIETFAGEGTRELYVGAPGSTGLLLLMQPIADGPYARALAKRGPGLHHVAVRVEDARAWAHEAGHHGWLLHTASLTSWDAARTLWLCRPGIAGLVEVSEGAAATGAPFVEAVDVRVEAAQADRVAALDVTGLRGGAALASSAVVIGGERWTVHRPHDP